VTKKLHGLRRRTFDIGCHLPLPKKLSTRMTVISEPMTFKMCHMDPLQ